MARFVLLLCLVVVLDQLSKFWIVQHFGLHETMPIIPGFFNLTYLRNTGAAFGIMAGHPAWWRQAFFIGVAVVALGIIIFMYRRLNDKSRWYGLSLGLIAGGAVGNLVDRIRFGSVVDFLDVYVGTHHWPAFNVADSAITIGVAVFLVKNILFEEEREKRINQHEKVK